jgi:hypothetical protein
MTKAGFFKVFLGIETPDEESLKLTKKLQNIATDLDEACQTINRAGLQIIAGCIIGFDNERRHADRRLKDFAIRNSIPEMFITPLQVRPGTDLWTRMEREGRLDSDTYRADLGSNTGVPNFLPTRPVEEIMEEVVNLYEELYEPGFFLQRTYEHFRAMRPLPFKRPFSIPRMEELKTVAITFFRQGVLYRSRLKFWKYLIKALIHFPKRIDLYASACISGEHFFEYRRNIREQWEARKKTEALDEQSWRPAGVETAPPAAISEAVQNAGGVG